MKRDRAKFYIAKCHNFFNAKKIPKLRFHVLEEISNRKRKKKKICSTYFIKIKFFFRLDKFLFAFATLRNII